MTHKPTNAYGSPAVMQEFESVEDYFRFVQSPVTTSGSRASIQPISRRFNLETWEETVKHSLYGWPDGRADVARLAAKLDAMISGEVPVMTIQYDVTGDYLDVGRFMTGEPEVWGTMVDSGLRVDSTFPKIVTIVMNQCISGSMNESTLRMRGAAVVALVDVLERHGIRCNIELCGINRSGVNTWVHVKDAGDTVQVDALAFILAHPDSFRRFMFSAWEHLPEADRKRVGAYKDDGYGYVDDLPEGDEERGDVYIAGHESASEWGEAATMLWLRKNLAAQGIALEKRDGE